MKKIFILNVILGVLLLYSCEVDNYSLPDKTLEGNIVDKVTGENIQTRQPDGIKIRLMESGFTSPQPYDFWAKSDGSFKNTKLFPSKFKVVAIEGAFETSSVDTLTVDLSSNQNITIQVEPYVRLTNVAIVASAGKISASYKIARTTSTKPLVKSLLICHSSVILHETTVGVKKSVENNLSAMTDPVITSTTFADEITGLTSGSTYYARVAILAANSLNRYNYSPIIKVVIP